MLDWGLFALGLFIGIVGATTALLAFVVVEYTEYELFKNNPSSPSATPRQAQVSSIEQSQLEQSGAKNNEEGVHA